MSDPKLTKAAVQIKYWSDDSYKSDMIVKGGGSEVGHITGAPVPPEEALLQGLEELQRLCNLFGFAKQADERIAAVNGRMAKWRGEPEPTTPEPIGVEAVAEVRLNKYGFGCLDWLIEGGISALPEGTVLVAAHKPITDDDGRGEVYRVGQEKA